MSPAALKELFEKVDVELEWRLKAGETDEHECKENFSFQDVRWMKAVAALANHRGGYLLFGIYDKGKKGPNDKDLGLVVCGLKTDHFEKADIAKFSTRLKSMFDPTPQFTTAAVKVGGLTVGVLHVKQHPSRPVIATKQEGDIREGDIHFRYPGQSSRIKYSDLRAILDDRDSLSVEQHERVGKGPFYGPFSPRASRAV
jgi:predicted HTH transcriptional regulator